MIRSRARFTLYYERVVMDTGDAYLLDVGPGPQVWIPTKDIREHDKDAKTIDIPEWLATDRGLT